MYVLRLQQVEQHEHKDLQMHPTWVVILFSLAFSKNCLGALWSSKMCTHTHNLRISCESFTGTYQYPIKYNMWYLILISKEGVISRDATHMILNIKKSINWF